MFHHAWKSVIKKRISGFFYGEVVFVRSDGTVLTPGLIHGVVAGADSAGAVVLAGVIVGLLS